MNLHKKLSIAYFDLDDIRNPLLAGGQATATYQVGTRLAKKGHTVTVYCSRYPGYKDRTEDGITYKHIALGSKNIKLNNLFYILLMPFYAPKVKADLIIESFVAPVSTTFSPLFTKIPVIGLPSMFNAMEFTKKYHLPFHWVEKFGMKFYKYMLPYSDVDSKKAYELNPNLIYKIVPQGVGSEYFAIKQKKPKYILYLSRFDIAQKGIDLLLQSYAKVADSIGYPLVLAGHGPDEERVRKMIKELGIQKQVKIIGPTYGKKKYEVMSEALFVAFPSRHDEICLWALEALAGGLPLIAFDIPESRWMTKDIAIQAKSFDVNAYAQALLKATEKKRIKKMRTASRAFAKKFTWGKVIKEYDAFFTEVLTRESKIN